MYAIKPMGGAAQNTECWLLVKLRTYSFLFSFNILYLSLAKRHPSLFINSCAFRARARALVVSDIVILYSLSVFPSSNKLVLEMCEWSLDFTWPTSGHNFSVQIWIHKQGKHNELPLNLPCLEPILMVSCLCLGLAWDLLKRGNTGSYLLRLNPFL